MSNKEDQAKKKNEREEKQLGTETNKNVKQGENRPDGPTTEGRIKQDSSVKPEETTSDLDKTIEKAFPNVEVNDNPKTDGPGEEFKEVMREQSTRGTVNSKEDKGNGKVYTDPRVNPSDTNAPDAGLTPEGYRIAS